MLELTTDRRLRIAVLVSGNGRNLQAIIDGIEQDTLPAKIVCVLSSRADAYALVRAHAAQIPTKVLETKDFSSREQYDAALAEFLLPYRPDLVVLAGFLRILGPGFVETFFGKLINLHPSLLPAFPGLHAPRQALSHGVKMTGCTVHFVDAGLDSGPILLQRAVPVLDDDSEASLMKRIQQEENEAICAAISLFAHCDIKIHGRRVEIGRQGGPVR